LKQAVGALDADTLEILRCAPADFAVLAGDDAFIAPTILLGGHGSITASAHVCTSLFARLIDAALDGDVSTTRTLAETLLPIVEIGFTEPNPASWKGALHRLGLIPTPALRAPMTTANDATVDQLLAAIHDASA